MSCQSSATARNRAFARQMIRASKGLTAATVKSRISKGATQSAFCSQPGVGDPGDCSLYNPPAEAGFPGSIVEMKGGTTIVDPATCNGAGVVTAPVDHFLNGHLDTNLGCPEDGDVVMWRAGTGDKPGAWVSASLQEAFARACLQLPESLSAEDCAAALADAVANNKAIRGFAAPREGLRAVAAAPAPEVSVSIADSSVEDSRTFGSGADGDLVLQEDSELTKDMYFHNLNLNGFALATNGYRLFVSGSLSAGRHSVTGHPGVLSANGHSGSSSAEGSVPAAGTLGQGGAPNASLDYSISGSAGSDAAGQLGPKAKFVPEEEGGVYLLSELDTAIRMRALDGKRLNGGAGGVGPHAGSGGGVLFVSARSTLLSGVLESRGGAAGASDSGAGGGGAIVFLHADSNKWDHDVRGGDQVAEAGRFYDIKV